MYNIDLQHFKVVAAIEKEGSMTRAAEKLHLSQSALSHHLKELEKNIGIKVFNRRNKKLWITEAGKKIIETSGVILDEVNKLGSVITTLKKVETSHIRISTECYTCYNWLPRLIKKFNTVYPDCTVEIVTEATRNPLQFLQSGKLEIAVVGKRNNEPVKASKGLAFISLFTDEQVAVISKENPLAVKTKILPADLAGQTLFVYDAEEKDIDLIRLILKPANIHPKKIIKYPMTEIILEMVKANMGITIMAKWLAQPLLDEALVVRPFYTSFSKRTWYLATHKNQELLHKKFCEFIARECSKSKQLL